MQKLNDPTQLRTPGKRYLDFFVDEAGDDTLFDKKGRVIVGQEGCSNYFILGTTFVPHPDQLKRDLEALRAQLLADPYFKGVPSMQENARKTARSFHAKDDLAEVRRDVYRLLNSFDLSFACAAIDKHKLAEYVRDVLNPQGIRYTPNQLYDYMAGYLFNGLIEADMDCRVYVSKRGRSDRSKAVSLAIHRLLSKEVRSSAKIGIFTCNAWEHGGLQATDYFLWAVQRFYEKGDEQGEGRYLDFVRKSIFSQTMLLDDMPPAWAFDKRHLDNWSDEAD